MVNKYDNAQQSLNEALAKSQLDPESLEAQKMLINQMNTITPILKDSVNMLNKVDMNGLNNLIGSIGNIGGVLGNK